MANELEITGISKYSKNGVKVDMSVSSRVTVTGSKIAEVIQNVGQVSAEPLNTGDIALGSCGYVLIQNLSDSGSVGVREGLSGTDLIKIGAGQSAGPFEIANTSSGAGSGPHVIAYVNDCNIRVLAIER